MSFVAQIHTYLAQCQSHGGRSEDYADARIHSPHNVLGEDILIRINIRIRGKDNPLKRAGAGAAAAVAAAASNDQHVGTYAYIHAS